MSDRLKRQIYLGLLVAFALIFIFHIDGCDVLNFSSVKTLDTQASVRLKSVDGKSVNLVAVNLGDQVKNKKLEISFYVSSKEIVNSPVPLLVDLFGTDFDPPEFDFLVRGGELSSQPLKKVVTFQVGENAPQDLKVRYYTLSEQAIEISDFKIKIIDSKNPVHLFVELLKVFLGLFVFFEVWILFGKKECLFGEKILLNGYLVLATLTFLYCMSNNHYPFYGDSWGYWTYGKLFVKDGSFSILNYDNALRGYFFPLINYFQYYLAQTIGIDEHLLYRFFSSLSFAFFGYVLFPNFIKKLFDIKIYVWQRMAFFFMLFLFWRGYALFPLTDIYAIMAVISSIYLLSISEGPPPKSFSYLFSGFFVAMAINMRPSYVLVFIFIFILCLRSLFVNFSYKYFYKIPLNLALWFFGAIVIWSSQMEINKKYFEVNSPLVPMEKFFQGRNLMLGKLYIGLTTQKYESYVGTRHNAQVAEIVDLAGRDIIDAEKLGSFESYGHYFRVLLNYPISFVGIYLRHLFNGLDVMFETPYVDNFESPIKYLVQFANFTIWFFVIWISWVYLSRNGLGVFKRKAWAFFSAGILLVPTIVSIPTEPEVRFYMPVYLLGYMTVIALSYVGKELFLKRRRHQNLALYVLFITLALGYSWHLNQYVNFR